jgi:hypothetical protein
MRQIGISDKFYKIVKEMYSKTKHCVKSANSLTEFFQSNVGVRQGDNMSPNLFKIFIDDIQKELDSSYYPVMLNKPPLSCLLYADDMIVLSSSAEGLQASIEKLSKYCSQWNLKINYDKTK